MRSSLLSLVVLGGVGVYALPAVAGQTASIATTRAENAVMDFDVALLKAHERYGIATSDAALTKRDNLGVAAATLTNGNEYLCEVQIGTPPQKLKLNLDTGSSDLWVFSTSTRSSQVNGQAKYDPSTSTSSVRQGGQSWSITYFDESTASGGVWKDSVSIGGLIVTEQVVETADTVSPSFSQDSASSGLVGLGFDSSNTVRPTQALTLFSNMKKNLFKKLFTTSFSPRGKAAYNFGFIDETLYRGEITYTPVSTANGYWGFTSSGYAVGRAAFRAGRISAIADTGTSLMLLPQATVDEYYKGVANASAVRNSRNEVVNYVFPCTSQLPDFTFGVVAARIVIPGALMNVGTYSQMRGYCIGGMVPQGRAPTAVFGDVALRAAFVVWDVESTRLGWASPPA